ncbi:hypothetical protein Q8F55_007238 [Vanrija albida]|uniref:Chitin-binding type-3 domain-containing protein n=1 Tax=Vanrija albida TaxID=181172 RepID=A0ABR3PZJ4_9TREE
MPPKDPDEGRPPSPSKDDGWVGVTETPLTELAESVVNLPDEDKRRVSITESTASSSTAPTRSSWPSLLRAFARNRASATTAEPESIDEDERAQWVSGTTYATGDVVWVAEQPWRCETDHLSVVKPSGSRTSWTRLEYKTYTQKHYRYSTHARQESFAEATATSSSAAATLEVVAEAAVTQSETGEESTHVEVTEDAPINTRDLTTIEDTNIASSAAQAEASVATQTTEVTLHAPEAAAALVPDGVTTTAWQSPRASPVDLMLRGEGSGATAAFAAAEATAEVIAESKIDTTELTETETAALATVSGAEDTGSAAITVTETVGFTPAAEAATAIVLEGSVHPDVAFDHQVTTADFHTATAVATVEELAAHTASYASALVTHSATEHDTHKHEVLAWREIGSSDPSITVDNAGQTAEAGSFTGEALHTEVATQVTASSTSTASDSLDGHILVEHDCGASDKLTTSAVIATMGAESSHTTAASGDATAHDDEGQWQVYHRRRGSWRKDKAPAIPSPPPPSSSNDEAVEINDEVELDGAVELRGTTELGETAEPIVPAIVTEDAEEDQFSSTASTQSYAVAAWTEETHYAAGTVVSYNDKIYSCITDHTGDAPTEWANWALVEDPLSVANFKRPRRPGHHGSGHGKKHGQGHKRSVSRSLRRRRRREAHKAALGSVGSLSSDDESDIESDVGEGSGTVHAAGSNDDSAPSRAAEGILDIGFEGPLDISIEGTAALAEEFATAAVTEHAVASSTSGAATTLLAQSTATQSTIEATSSTNIQGAAYDATQASDAVEALARSLPAKKWAINKRYTKYAFVTFAGQLWLCLQEHVSLQAPSSGEYWRLANVKRVVQFRMWSSSERFATGALVLYNGLLYNALQESVGQVPVSGSYWTLYEQQDGTALVSRPVGETTRTVADASATVSVEAAAQTSDTVSTVVAADTTNQTTEVFSTTSSGFNHSAGSTPERPTTTAPVSPTTSIRSISTVSWSAGTTYTLDQVIWYRHEWWRCIQTHEAVDAPTQGEYWIRDVSASSSATIPQEAVMESTVDVFGSQAFDHPLELEEPALDEARESLSTSATVGDELTDGEATVNEAAGLSPELITIAATVASASGASSVASSTFEILTTEDMPSAASLNSAQVTAEVVDAATFAAENATESTTVATEATLAAIHASESTLAVDRAGFTAAHGQAASDQQETATASETSHSAAEPPLVSVATSATDTTVQLTSATGTTAESTSAFSVATESTVEGSASTSAAFAADTALQTHSAVENTTDSALAASLAAESTITNDSTVVVHRTFQSTDAISEAQGSRVIDNTARSVDSSTTFSSGLASSVHHTVAIGSETRGLASTVETFDVSEAPASASFVSSISVTQSTEATESTATVSESTAVHITDDAIRDVSTTTAPDGEAVHVLSGTLDIESTIEASEEGEHTALAASVTAALIVAAGTVVTQPTPIVDLTVQSTASASAETVESIEAVYKTTEPAAAVDQTTEPTVATDKTIESTVAIEQGAESLLAIEEIAESTTADVSEAERVPISDTDATGTTGLSALSQDATGQVEATDDVDVHAVSQAHSHEDAFETSSTVGRTNVEGELALTSEAAATATNTRSATADTSSFAFAMSSPAAAEAFAAQWVAEVQAQQSGIEATSVKNAAVASRAEQVTAQADMDAFLMAWESSAFGVGAAPDWSSTVFYTTGAIVSYGGQLWRCTKASVEVAPGEGGFWDRLGTRAKETTREATRETDTVTRVDDRANLAKVSAAFEEWYRDSSESRFVAGTQDNVGTFDQIAESSYASITVVSEWSSFIAYAANTVVSFEGSYWRSLETSVAGMTPAEGSLWVKVELKVHPVTTFEQHAEWESNVQYMAGTILWHNGEALSATTTHISSQEFASDEWVWEDAVEVLVATKSDVRTMSRRTSIAGDSPVRPDFGRSEAQFAPYSPPPSAGRFVPGTWPSPPRPLTAIEHRSPVRSEHRASRRIRASPPDSPILSPTRGGSSPPPLERLPSQSSERALPGHFPLSSRFMPAYPSPNSPPSLGAPLKLGGEVVNNPLRTPPGKATKLAGGPGISSTHSESHVELHVASGPGGSARPASVYMPGHFSTGPSHSTVISAPGVYDIVTPTATASTEIEENQAVSSTTVSKTVVSTESSVGAGTADNTDPQTNVASTSSGVKGISLAAAARITAAASKAARHARVTTFEEKAVWSADTLYDVDTVVWHGGAAWKCIAEHKAVVSPSTDLHWVKVDVGIFKPPPCPPGCKIDHAHTAASPIVSTAKSISHTATATASVETSAATTSSTEVTTTTASISRTTAEPQVAHTASSALATETAETLQIEIEYQPVTVADDHVLWVYGRSYAEDTVVWYDGVAWKSAFTHTSVETPSTLNTHWARVEDDAETSTPAAAMYSNDAATAVAAIRDSAARKLESDHDLLGSAPNLETVKEQPSTPVTTEKLGAMTRSLSLTSAEPSSTRFNSAARSVSDSIRQVNAPASVYGRIFSFTSRDTIADVATSEATRTDSVDTPTVSPTTHASGVETANTAQARVAMIQEHASWSINTVYASETVVWYDGVAWSCIKAHTSTAPPSEGEFWSVYREYLGPDEESTIKRTRTGSATAGIHKRSE